MITIEILFWIAVLLVVGTYAGYPILLRVFLYLKQKKDLIFYSWEELPAVTLIVACYNEADILQNKINNTQALHYPDGKLKVWFVTDGSDDNSSAILSKYPSITHHHKDERKGKNAAINRIMPLVKTSYVIFCDANTNLNPDAIVNIVRHYKDETVGGVAGEKRVTNPNDPNAASAGEGAYWKYESTLKKWDSDLNTVVGAAGELFSIRTELYEEVPPNVVIEDFRLSMNIAKQGLKIRYEPTAYAVETGSASVEEENKRKVRISAGGLIEVAHFLPLLNIFKYGLLSFQYIGHRMARWTFAPFGLLLVFITNIVLAVSFAGVVYKLLFLGQVLFYTLAFIGHVLRNSNPSKIFLIPYYFVFMNVSVYLGLFRLIRGAQSAVWEKAKRG